MAERGKEKVSGNIKKRRGNEGEGMEDWCRARK